MASAGAALAVDVGTGGSPSVELSIAVPPGIHQLQPALSVSYSGGNANGVLGVGWSLNAYSGIARCGPTRATDGRFGHVVNTINDKLCLDGQRLIPLDANGAATVVGAQTGDTSGQAAGAFKEFRTEVDIHARIRAYGYADGSTAASGPLYFRVWTKDGQIVDYGNSPNSDARTNATVTAAYPTDATTHYAKAWLMSRVADVFGNVMNYKYNQRSVNWGSSGASQAGREWTPAEIQYGGNKVVFGYTDRASGAVRDGSESYVAIDKTVILNRLASITTYVNSPNTGALGPGASAVVAQITRFGYTTSPRTGRSLLGSVQTCASATVCQPPESFQYTQGGDQTYVKSTSFNLGAITLYNLPTYLDKDWTGFGTYGLLSGDFNGDGRTDLIRYATDDATHNHMYLSNGKGAFNDTVGTFNITDQLLFRSDGCVQTSAQDYDNDGLVDLFVYSSPTHWHGGTAMHPGYTECAAPAPPQQSAIYRNNGDGTFTRQPIVITGTNGQTVPLDVTTFDAIYYTVDPFAGTQGYYWGEGHVFYFVDLDGDGVLDLVTSLRPQRPYGLPNTTLTGCTGVCTRVFKGDGHGRFSERPTNISGLILYNSGGLPPSQARSGFDVNEDGYPDLLIADSTDSYANQAHALALLSRGDFNFDQLASVPNGTPVNSVPGGLYLDYNGDGREDSYSSKLFVGDRQAGFSSNTRFNLTQAGQLTALDGAPVTNVGTDLDGDGKQDFMRVDTYNSSLPFDATDSSAFLSNGDGSFTKSTSYNIDALIAADGFTTGSPPNSWVMGDFTGHGQPEILLLSPTKNSLYVMASQTRPDLLSQVTSPSGAATTFSWIPLANPYVPGDSVTARYAGDRGGANAATGNSADVNANGYVVGQMQSDNGVGGTTATDFFYAGLKRDQLGRGSLGFHDVRRQHPGPDGMPLTQQALFAQGFPYTGRPLQDNVFMSTLKGIGGSNELGATTNVYCDQTSPASASGAAISSGISCTSTSAQRRPYLLWSQTKGWDIGRAALPTRTRQTAVNADGAPTTATETTAMPAATDVFAKTSVNSYAADDTACTAFDTCHWIIARVQTNTVTSSVPATIPGTSPGTAPNASATRGNGAHVQVPPAMVMPAVTSVLLTDDD